MFVWARSHIWSGTYIQKTMLLNKFLLSTLACIIVVTVCSVPPQGLWNAETLFSGSRCPVYIGKKQPSLDRMSVYWRFWINCWKLWVYCARYQFPSLEVVSSSHGIDIFFNICCIRKFRLWVCMVPMCHLFASTKSTNFCSSIPMHNGDSLPKRLSV